MYVLSYALFLVLLSTAMAWVLFGNWQREVGERATFIEGVRGASSGESHKLAVDLLNAHARKYSGTRMALRSVLVACLASVFMLGAVAQQLAIGRLDMFPSVWAMPLVMSIASLVCLFGLFLCAVGGARRGAGNKPYIEALEAVVRYQTGAGL